jgi:hypothetical protein
MQMPSQRFGVFPVYKEQMALSLIEEPIFVSPAKATTCVATKLLQESLSVVFAVGTDYL